MARDRSGSVSGINAMDAYWGFTLYDQVYLPIAVLLGMTVLMLVLLLIFLKRRDPV